MSDERILVFDRTPIGRLISCVACFGSGALFFDYLAQGWSEVELFPLAGLSLLVLGTLAAAFMQYGDHIYVAPHGLMYENRLLSLIGHRGRWLRWDDVIEVREIRRKVLILLSLDGRRVLVDAILGYAIARNEILKRVPHAIFSGTLQEEKE